MKAEFTGLEIWTERNRVKNLPEFAGNTSKFDCWRDWHLWRRVKHDVVRVIIGQSLGKYHGHAFLSGICTATHLSLRKL